MPVQVPVLQTPIVVPEKQEQITVTKPALNCTQVGLLTLSIQWKPKADGTMGVPVVVMALSPYDKVQNRCADNKVTQLGTCNIEALALALAQVNRPALATALQAIYDGLQDLGNEGIPAEIISALNASEKQAKLPLTQFKKGF